MKWARSAFETMKHRRDPFLETVKVKLKRKPMTDIPDDVVERAAAAYGDASGDHYDCLRAALAVVWAEAERERLTRERDAALTRAHYQEENYRALAKILGERTAERDALRAEVERLTEELDAPHKNFRAGQ
jgi:hypothetical protein